MTGEDEEGRRSFEQPPWSDVYERLVTTAACRPLDAEDLERLAVAAYFVGRDEDALEAWERAHQVWLRLGDPDRAARCAFWLGLGLQRRLRDIHAVTQHFLVRPDTMIIAGAVRAGQDVDVPVF